MRQPIPAPGAVVWIRQRRWRVERARLDRNVLRLDVADRRDRLTFLAPYDRPVTTARRARLVHGRVQQVRARAGAFAASTFDVQTVVTAQSAHIDILPHQLEPALAIVDGHRRVLIADEVGLGKTIQAGLIIGEICRRLPAARVLVIVPRTLRGQWHDELALRFGLTSHLVDRETLGAAATLMAPNQNPWRRPGILLTSPDFLKQPHVFGSLPLDPWDLIVIDEAHGVTGNSGRHDTCDELGRRARHLVLLSATPHSGDETRFRRLLRLGALAGCQDEMQTFSRTRASLGQAYRRRVRLTRLTAPERVRRIYDALDAFEHGMLRRAHASKRDATLLLLAVYRRRAFSTVHAFSRTLDRRIEWLDGKDRIFALDWIQPALPFGSEDDDLPDEDRMALTVDVDMPPSEERLWLRRLCELSRDAAKDDPKLARIARMLTRTVAPAVIFTEFRHSLECLSKRLSGIRTLAVLHGGQSDSERRVEIQRFIGGVASVLISTDVGGQGLNFQTAAWWVVNLELPWTPSRLEQRIGRVDRIGQHHPVHATVLVTDHSMERSLLAVLARNTHVARQAFDFALARDVVSLSAIETASVLISGAPLPPSLPINAPPPAMKWKRRACAMARVLRRRRALTRRWRAADTQAGRPVATRGVLPSGLSTTGGRTLVGYIVPIVDAAGTIVERHAIVIALDGRLRADDVRRLAPTLEQIAARRVRARLARIARVMSDRAATRVATEQAVASHLRRIRAPEEAQLGLFSRREARSIDDAMETLALADEQARARIALEHASADVSMARPELSWIWTSR